MNSMTPYNEMSALNSPAPAKPLVPYVSQGLLVYRLKTTEREILLSQSVGEKLNVVLTSEGCPRFVRLTTLSQGINVLVNTHTVRDLIPDESKVKDVVMSIKHLAEEKGREARREYEKSHPIVKSEAHAQMERRRRDWWDEKRKEASETRGKYPQYEDFPMTDEEKVVHDTFQACLQEREALAEKAESDMINEVHAHLREYVAKKFPGITEAELDYVLSEEAQTRTSWNASEPRFA